MRLVGYAASALVLATLALPQGAVQAGTTGSLVGVVRDGRTGAPIANTMVRANSGAAIETTQSDARGDFVFVSLIPGDYTITGARAGYWPSNEYDVVVRADTSLHLALTLMAKANGTGVYVTSRTAGNLVAPGTEGIIDDWTSRWPDSSETADISVYYAGIFDGYALPWSNGFFIQMTPSITLGAGVPMNR